MNTGSAVKLLRGWAAGLAWPIRTLARVTPDGLLFAALAVMCGMLSAGSNAWSNIPLLISLVLFALWLLALWRGTRALQAIGFRRRHAEHVFAGDALNVTVFLNNRSRLPAAGLTLDEDLEQDPSALPVLSRSGALKADAAAARETSGVEIKTRIPGRRMAAAHGRAFVVSLSGKETERATYSLALNRRGVYRFAPSKIETVYPLGFFRSVALRRAPGRLVVYPRLGEIGRPLFADVEQAQENLKRARPSRAEAEFRGLREYRKEDNPRWIHWRGSARAGKLLVREFEEPLSKRVLILIDVNLRRMGNRRFAAFENAISFAATAAREFARRGNEVECAALQPPEGISRATASRARGNLDDLLEMLALLRRDDSRNLEALAATLPRSSLHGAFVLVVGLGSLRDNGGALKGLRMSDNAVKIIDGGSDDLGRIFKRAARGSPQDLAAEEDWMMSSDEEEEVSE